MHQASVSRQQTWSHSGQSHCVLNVFLIWEISLTHSSRPLHPRCPSIEQEELWIQPKKRIKSQTTASLGVQLSGPKFFPWEVEEVGTSAEDHSSSPNHPKRRLKTEKKNSEESSSSPHDPDLQRIEGELGFQFHQGSSFEEAESLIVQWSESVEARSPKELRHKLMEEMLKF